MNIIITGASSGLGYELALRYDKKDYHLFLLARREEKLKELSLKFKNAKSTIIVVDVGEFVTLQEKIRTILQNNKIDLVVANAGISLGHKKDSLSIDDFQNIININLLSTHALLEPIIEQFKMNKYGKIVIISSMASYVTMPSSIAYSTSKRALSAYAEGLRNQLKQYNIKVINIKPGFIKSEMTNKNDFSMPFLLDTKSGVDKIYNAIEKEIGEYAFPFNFWLITKTISLLPYWLKDFVIQKLLFKKSS